MNARCKRGCFGGLALIPNNPQTEIGVSMIRRVFQMLRDWKRGPVKQSQVSESDTLGFSNCGFGAIGE
jgi:hypothetical protein